MIFRHRQQAGRPIGAGHTLGAYGVIRQLVVLLMVALFTGAWHAEPPRDAALVLAEGIHELNNPSADFRAVLRAMPSRLTANSSVRAAILKFVERLPPTGADFKCSDDFLKNRARQELIRLQQALSNVADRVEPQFCFATPYVIDAVKPIDAVEIYGFDFDAEPIQMVLVSGGKYQDVTSALMRRSHYHLTLKLGRNGVALRAQTQTLGLTWGNLIHHSIPVVTPASPLCPSDIESISPSEAITYSPPALSRANVTRMSAGKPLASSALDYAGNAVYATVCLTVTARDHARATFSGCNREFVGTIDPDAEIEQLVGHVESQAVRTAKGSPSVTVKFTKIRVVSTRTGDCVSPIAYNEARREGALSAATTKALDVKLRPVNRAVAGLRPRYAPPVNSSTR